MKKLFLIAGFLVFGFFCNAQDLLDNEDDYTGSFPYFFFGHETSISASATGNMYLTQSSDAFSSIYNPAYPSVITNPRLSYSGSQRYYSWDNAFYNSIGIDIPVKGIGTFSFVRKYFNLGEDLPITTATNPDGDGTFVRPRQISYNLNYSCKLFSLFSAGIGINYFSDLALFNYKYYSFNFGLFYNHELPASSTYSHSVSVSAAFMNFISIKNKKEEVVTIPSGTFTTVTPTEPKINHVNLEYTSALEINNMSEKFTEVQATIGAGYSWLFNAAGNNSPDYSTASVGIECKLFEMAALRIGYYNFDYFERTEELTYGAGLSIPFYKLTSVPVSLAVDYSYRKNGKENSVYSPLEFKNYNSFSLNVSYQFNQ